jgi:hypothetical protein
LLFLTVDVRPSLSSVRWPLSTHYFGVGRYSV